MKKWVSILLLVILTGQMCSGLMTLVSFHIYREEIARTQCINRFDAIPVCKGSCYLEKELKKDLEKVPLKHPVFKLNMLEWMTPPDPVYPLTDTFCETEIRTFFTLYKTGDIRLRCAAIFHPPRIAIASIA